MCSCYNSASDKNTNIKDENQENGITPYLKNQDTVQPSHKKPDTIKGDTINGDIVKALQTVIRQNMGNDSDML